MLGRTLIEKYIAISQGLNIDKMDVSTLSKGTYVLQVITTKSLYRVQKQFVVK